MRIILIGQAVFGKDALDALILQGENVVGVITVSGKAGQPLVELAENNRLPVLQPKRLKDPEAVDWVRTRAPDLLVLAFVTEYVPKEMIEIATYGGINYHPSLLPKYRGGSAMNWAIINGEKETGVTIHRIDEGVDTGPILLQERVLIDSDDTLKSLYFKKMYPLGIRMIADAVRMIRDGNATFNVQDHSIGTFQPVIKESDVIIDWRQPTQKIYDLIRGSNPAPGATVSFRGDRLKIWEASPCLGNGKPGDILEIRSDQGFVIATSDGAILVTRVQYRDSGKIAAFEFVENNGLNAGDRLDM